MAWNIRLAETEEERERVYRLRYRIYVEEMGRDQKFADPRTHRIIEPLDKDGHIFAAFEGDDVVGTLRVNLGQDSDLGYYPQLYGMDWAGRYFPHQVSVTTKLMVAPDYRRSTLGVRLARAACRMGREKAVRYDFIDCNEHLEAFFTGLGYRRYRDYIHHPEYGRVLPMVLDTCDADHLRSVRSPVLKDLIAFQDQESVPDHVPDARPRDIQDVLAACYTKIHAIERQLSQSEPRPEKGTQTHVRSVAA